MLDLSSQDFEFLNAGGTLVVPSAQRAAAVRLAHDSMQLRAGLRTWPTPRVLAWSGWLEAGLDEARARGVSVPRRLSGIEIWWLWRDALRAACTEDLAVLWPDGLIDAARRSTLLLEDFGITVREEASAEATVLARARAGFLAACERQRALWVESWRACAPYLLASSQTRLRGFDSIGPARVAWLRGLGVEVHVPAGSRPEAALATPVPRVQVLSGPEHEARAAAQWCRQRLARDGRARLLVVAPGLAEQRHRWVRAFDECFGARQLLRPDTGRPSNDTGSDAPADIVGIEGGEPLAAYGLVELALLLLSLGAGEHGFDTLSTVLRTPYLPDAGRSERLRIDTWLREEGVDPEQAALPALMLAAAGALGDPAAAILRALLAPIEPLPEDPEARSRASPAGWARRFAQRLQSAGWPGESLGSAEQQLRVRFEELLGEMALLHETILLGASEACALLRQVAHRTSFEAATDDAPVTLTRDLLDPIARYDGIWVAGLTAEAWPEKARPDPLIPFLLQAAAGMPGADPAEPLSRALRSLARWRASTSDLVLSHAASDGDVANDPSPLLRELGDGTPVTAPAGAELATLDPGAWLAGQAPPLEDFIDDRGPPWPQGDPLRGGAHLLELQALCPFRAFAEVRLRARSLGEPVPGIAPQVRGEVLHRALELFWQDLKDSSALRARRGELLDLARACADRALLEAHRRVPGGLDTRLMRHETERNVRLFDHLITWELTRGDFRVEAIEHRSGFGRNEARLQLRLDRIDRLAGGELVIFDYKTGTPEKFEPDEIRPRHPQLPAYAVTTGARTAAVAMLYLTREGIRMRGVSDQDGRIPQLRASRSDRPDWTTRLAHWRSALEGLLEEFLSGEAQVRPLERACDRCHLQMACRIQPNPETEQEPDDGDGEGEA